MISQVYIKNVNLNDKNFIEAVLKMYPVHYTINKNTITLFDVPEELYNDLIDFKNDLKREGKTIIIYT